MNLISMLRTVWLAVCLISAGVCHAGTYSITLPEYNGNGVVGATETIGTFAVVIPPGETLVSAVISGYFGNSESPSTAAQKIYAGGVNVATCIQGSDCWNNLNSPLPWSYTFSTTELSNLSNKGVALTDTQTDCCVIRLGATTLTYITSAASAQWGGATATHTQTQVKAFDYDSASGLITKEVIEPGDSNLCLVTVHDYDNLGNETGRTKRNCNGSVANFPGSGTAINGEAAAPSSATTLGQQATIASRTSNFTYTTDGRFPLTTTNALNQGETYTFDPVLGVPTKLVGPNNLATQWAYDGLGRKILEQRADGNGTKWDYKYCKTSTYATGTEACPTIHGVEAAYVVTKTPVKNADVTAPASATANGAYYKIYYDALNRVIQTETQGYDGSGVSTLIYQDTWYNNLNQISQTSQPYFAGATAQQWTKYSYDLLGRKTDTVQPDGSQTRIVYFGLAAMKIDNLFNMTAEVHNVANQLYQVIDANNKTLTYTYDALGDVLSTQDSLGNVISAIYDNRGRKTKMVDPDMGSWSYAYDVLDELVSQIDGNQKATTLEYDKLGRLTSKVGVTASSTWIYDNCSMGTGKVCKVSGTNGYVQTTSYDSLGRPYLYNSTIGNVSYSSGVLFDADGRISYELYPGASFALQHVYTPLGYLQAVKNSTTGLTYWTANSIDAAGHVTAETYGNGVTSTSTYDPNTGRLLQRVAGPSNAVQNNSYTYDTLGNLQIDENDSTGLVSVYQYDALNRLKAEYRWSGALATVAIRWAYDDIGNIQTRSDLGSYAYNSSGASSVRPHAVIGVTGTVNGQVNPAYQYDDNGNLIGETVAGAQIRQVSWTGSNRVQSIKQTTTGTQLDYLYDPNDDRVREVYSKNGVPQRTTVYLNQGGGAGLLYEEESGVAGDQKKYYINANGQTIGVVINNGTATTTQYWHKDHLGSTSVITDESGNVVERLAYEPFGKRRNLDGTTDANGTLTGVNTRRGFTGHEHIDEVDLINMNGRIFDPTIGRFLSADPNVPDPQSMQSYGRYTYARNNPLAETDPTGFEDCSIDGFCDGAGSGLGCDFICINAGNGYIGVNTNISIGGGGGAPNPANSSLGLRALWGDPPPSTFSQGSLPEGGNNVSLSAAYSLLYNPDSTTYYGAVPVPAIAAGAPEPTPVRSWSVNEELAQLHFDESVERVENIFSDPYDGWRYDRKIGIYRFNEGVIDPGILELGIGSIAAKGPGAFMSVSESMSARAASYQLRAAGTDASVAYVVNGVKFDGYIGGTLIDAKSGYGQFVKNGQFQSWFGGADSFAAQAQRQLSVANGTPIQWRFMEESAANATKSLFQQRGITGIDVVHFP